MRGRNEFLCVGNRKGRVLMRGKRKIPSKSRVLKSEFLCVEIQGAMWKFPALSVVHSGEFLCVGKLNFGPRLVP
jgi:hypothetical protein